MNFLIRHKSTIALVGLLVIGVFWYSASGSPSPASLLSTQTPADNPAEKELVSSLLALRAVSLSGTIFTDPAFRGLRDYSTQLVPEDMGRSDPFAPLSAPAAPATAANNGQLWRARP